LKNVVDIKLNGHRRRNPSPRDYHWDPRGPLAASIIDFSGEFWQSRGKTPIQLDCPNRKLHP